MPKFSGFLWLTVLALVFAAPSAFGQTANLYLNDPGNNVMDGIYVGPYNAVVNNTTPQQIICDDFADETYQHEYWQANVTNVSSSMNLSGLMWGNSLAGGGSWLGGAQLGATQGYEAMLYLASQLLGTSDPNKAGYLSYAIWAVFNPNAVFNWLTAHGDTAALTAVKNLVNGALQLAGGGKLSFAQFSGWEILTPTSCSANCGSGLPQEFLMYVPEGGAALGYLLLGVLSCVVAGYYRRRVHA
jgi:hypothetical protein